MVKEDRAKESEEMTEELAEALEEDEAPVVKKKKRGKARAKK
jgi:hypothetical protein